MPNKRDTTEQGRTRRPVSLTSGVVLLRQALGPRASVEWPQGAGGRPPGEVVVRWAGAAGEPQRLRLVPWGASPNDHEASTSTASGAPIVWVLRRASAAQRDALRARGEPFIDLGGAVHLTLPWALVDRTDLTPVRPAANQLRSKADPFADKSSLVLRTMLEQRDPRRVWGVRELAGAAGVGVATASDVLKALAERHLISITRHGRAAEVRVANPAAIVDAWTRAYDWRLNRGLIVQAPVGDPERFLRRLPRLMHPRYRWALTLQAGASLVAPHATWDRIHVYIDVPPPDRADSMHVLAAIAARAEWPSAPDGRLVLMVPHYTTSAWHGLRTVRGLPVVSDLQLVLDLWHYPLALSAPRTRAGRAPARPDARQPCTGGAAE